MNPQSNDDLSASIRERFRNLQLQAQASARSIGQRQGRKFVQEVMTSFAQEIEELSQMLHTYADEINSRFAEENLTPQQEDDPQSSPEP